MITVRMKRELRKAHVSSTQETLPPRVSAEHSAVLDVYLIKCQESMPCCYLSFNTRNNPSEWHLKETIFILIQFYNTAAKYQHVKGQKKIWKAILFQ